MLFFKKKVDSEKDTPQEENPVIDFDYIEMMARTEFLIPFDRVGFMTYGQYIDQFNAYTFIYNFKTKKCLYSDAEEEVKKYQQDHRKIDSVFAI